MKNMFMIAGNVGQKPELKTAKSGVSYLAFSVAVSERYKAKDSDNYETKTEWFNCVVYDKKAEGLAKVLDKGSSVIVSGKLEMRSQEVEGKNIKNIQLVVQDVVLMGAKRSTEDAE